MDKLSSHNRPATIPWIRMAFWLYKATERNQFDTLSDWFGKHILLTWTASSTSQNNTLM
jgi:hypothetical protein